MTDLEVRPSPGERTVRMTATNLKIQEVSQAGFTILPEVFTGPEVDAMLHDLGRALAGWAEGAAVRSQQGTIYAARNVLALWPPAARCVAHSSRTWFDPGHVERMG